MILDSSAIVALVFQEPGHERVQERMFSDKPLGIGAPTLVETAIVLSSRLRQDARGLLARLLQTAGIETIPFSIPHYEVAVSAWLKFGKGRHPAALNLGDCFSYAVARLAKQPLLCIGNDFILTDLPVVPL
jgi:ribonuclease VapC